jgi:hypothetical protein
MCRCHLIILLSLLSFAVAAFDGGIYVVTPNGYASDYYGYRAVDVRYN